MVATLQSAAQQNASLSGVSYTGFNVPIFNIGGYPDADNITAWSPVQCSVVDDQYYILTMHIIQYTLHPIYNKSHVRI